MSGEDAALGSGGWRDEEVKRLLKVAVISTVLNETSVDDTTTWRVVELSILVNCEESLVDPLVNHDKS